MPEQRDVVLIEQARIQRMRLGAALLYGRIGERRTVNDHLRRLIGSVIVAAIACAACAGVSFVGRILADQASSSTGAVVRTVAPPASEAP